MGVLDSALTTPESNCYRNQMSGNHAERLHDNLCVYVITSYSTLTFFLSHNLSARFFVIFVQQNRLLHASYTVISVKSEK